MSTESTHQAQSPDMPQSRLISWRSDYQKKSMTAQRAIRLIRRGHRVFIGSGCGEPQHLVRALESLVVQLADLEILHLLSLGKASYTDDTFRDKCRLKSFFVASGSRQAIAEGRADYTPIFIYDVPALFRSRHLPLDVALIQVSPPDEHGFCSYGVSVDIVKAAAESASIIIAQVNPRMPRVLGDAYIHASEIDAIVEHTEELLEMPPPLLNETAHQIGRHVALLVEDGSTIRAGVGSLSNAALYALEEKRDLGVHTDMLTDAYVHLVEKGVITNSKKTLHPKKIVVSFCLGSRKLFDFVNNNPMVEFHPTEYTNDFFVISKNDKMVCINSALEVDLSGQVCSDSMGYTIYSGVGGTVDFIRGSLLSKGGMSIFVLPSTTLDGKQSRLVPTLSEGAGVVNTRGGVHYIVTEFGAVNLHGKSIRERALALISIAHPQFREELLHAAQRMYRLYEEEAVPRAAETKYPDRWEITPTLRDGSKVLLRPIKPTDESSLKEFFSALPQHGHYVRFLSVMKVFPRPDFQAFLNVDYEKEMGVVGVVGPPGAERIVALGRYLLDEETNTAEVDFAVHPGWQGKGLASFLLRHLVEIGRSKRIAGFLTYVDASNRGALSVFDKAGCEVRQSVKGEIVAVHLVLLPPAPEGPIESTEP
ncbi:MAG TPA: GNAT family N-acetyltransferase [Syntrophobacteria bacterium]|nr:GNAT family N-acetyltransferase [Syntrophobacteria bacterium]